MMKKIDFDLNSSAFSNFFTSRYSMSSRVNVMRGWKFTKENDLSFFIVSLGCLLKGLNSTPEMCRRIINEEVVEFDRIDAITPITSDDEIQWKEMKVSLPKKDETVFEWHDSVSNQKNLILNEELEAYDVAMDKRDSKPVANFSCIPWVDFDSLNNCILEPHQIQPLVNWGKVSNKKTISVSTTVNHIFVFGKALGTFYDKVQYYFDDPERIAEK